MADDTARDSLAARLAPLPERSLLDLVDNLLDKGVVLDGEVRLGIAGIDLITLRVAALLAAAHRVDGGTVRGSEVPPSAFPPSALPPSAFPPSAFPSSALPPSALPPSAFPSSAFQGSTVPLEPSAAGTGAPPRWNPEPENAARAVMQLVLTLADFIRQLLERQAVRRMEQDALSAEETERLGRGLMELERTIHDLARQAGIEPHELNLDLGPLGRLT